MLSTAIDLGGLAAVRTEGRGAPEGVAEVGRATPNPGREIGGFQTIGALAGAAIERLRRMQENKALVAFLAGMAMGDAYRELLRIAAADRPGLRATAQEIETEALARVASFAAMPMEGAAQIDTVMEQVRALARAHWTGSARNAPRAEAPAPGGSQLVASRRRGRPIAAE